MIALADLYLVVGVICGLTLLYYALTSKKKYAYVGILLLPFMVLLWPAFIVGYALNNIFNDGESKS